ncbi:ribosomal protein S2 [Iris pallida]|uniref:Ribosomal protein S2 (Mitochondrion) n=1 Tax=Iris pallida TaxID=29817 RepID=A0AAX6GDM3_IRIPA|nr:ribosomal protein S2 [Iris pallida]KAJ6826836.1 ribosomal protein S2 [Iris pallida]
MTNPKVLFNAVTKNVKGGAIPGKFRYLWTGENGLRRSGVQFHYRSSTFHRVIPNTMPHGWVFTRDNWTSSESLFDKKSTEEKEKTTKTAIQSLVTTKLLTTNAHLGRRVAAHHFKTYICGSRNGVNIIDSDKTLICLRNAFNFMSALIREKGRFLFLKTNNIFIQEIMEEMASRVNCSQWKIGNLMTNPSALPRKISRKKKLNLGSTHLPDCIVILDVDSKSSVIREADQSQIPIVSIVDPQIPLESYKRISYPIPANATRQFIYLFCHLMTKIAFYERERNGDSVVIEDFDEIVENSDVKVEDSKQLTEDADVEGDGDLSPLAAA